jgi:hypothetical protein
MLDNVKLCGSREILKDRYSPKRAKHRVKPSLCWDKDNNIIKESLEIMFENYENIQWEHSMGTWEQYIIAKFERTFIFNLLFI